MSRGFGPAQSVNFGLRLRVHTNSLGFAFDLVSESRKKRAVNFAVYDTWKIAGIAISADIVCDRAAILSLFLFSFKPIICIENTVLFRNLKENDGFVLIKS